MFTNNKLKTVEYGGVVSCRSAIIGIGVLVSISLVLLFIVLVPITVERTEIKLNNRVIVFEGMTHVGTPAFYDQVRGDILTYRNRGFSVVYEGVSGLPVKRSCLRLSSGLVMQPSYESVLNLMTDINADQGFKFSKSDLKTINASFGFSQCGVLSPYDIRWRYRVARLVNSFTDSKRSSLVLDERNARVAKIIEGTTGDLVIVFGNDHMRGILKKLRDDGIRFNVLTVTERESV